MRQLFTALANFRCNVAALMHEYHASGLRGRTVALYRSVMQQFDDCHSPWELTDLAVYHQSYLRRIRSAR